MSNGASVTSSRFEDALQARRMRRSRRILLAAGSLMLLLGAGWSLFFMLRGARIHALVETVLMLLGGTVLLLARANRNRLAAWTAFAGLFVFVCFFSAVVDVQSAQVPRTTHLFLLILAAASHFVFRAEPALPRYGCVVVFLSAFIVFAALPEDVPGPYAMGDGVRHVGIWFNLLSVAAATLVILHLQESDAAAHRALHAELRDALAERRFELFYQPQQDADGRVVGTEALLRWRHPVLGLVGPGEFMAAAEDTGFILPLGQWVLGEACTQLRRWQDHPALSRLRLSINISALQLRQPDFVPQVLGYLKHRGVDNRLLTLELTESVLLEDVEGAKAKMQALQEAGVGLSLDDFGTGYASLSYLHQMPFTELKIDRAFVSGIVGDAQASSITRNLLRLGQDLGIEVIAEGVETVDQYELLLGQGCRRFQGYLFGKPMQREAFEAMLGARGGGEPVLRVVGA